MTKWVCAIVFLAVIGFLLYKSFSPRSSQSFCVFCEGYGSHKIDNFKFITLYNVRRKKEALHRYRVCVSNEDFLQSFSFYEDSCKRGIMEGDYSAAFIPDSLMGIAQVEVFDMQNSDAHESFRMNVINLNQRSKPPK